MRTGRLLLFPLPGASSNPLDGRKYRLSTNSFLPTIYLYISNIVVCLLSLYLSIQMLSVLNDIKSDMISRCEGKFQQPTQEHEKKTETATNYSKLWELHEEKTNIYKNNKGKSRIQRNKTPTRRKMNKKIMGESHKILRFSSHDWKERKFWRFEWHKNGYQ